MHLLNRKDGVSFSLLSLVTQCNILSRKSSGLGVLSLLSVEQTLGSNAGGCHFNSRALLRSAVVWLLLRLLTQRPTDRFMTACSLAAAHETADMELLKLNGAAGTRNLCLA